MRCSQVIRGGVILTNDNEESRRVVESCYKRHKTTLNPIIEWTDDDVWNFIRSEGIPYCELYDEGWHRLGCIGCPMARQHGREQEFLRWPKYKNAYLLAFAKMIEVRREYHKNNPDKPIWKQGVRIIENPSPIDIYNWWMENDTLAGQYTLFEEEGDYS